MKKVILGIVGAIIIGIIAIFFVLREGISITITESEIQSVVYKKFPIEKTHLIVLKVEYSNPIIELIDNKERIRLGITITPKVEINGKMHKGSVVVNGGFRYDPGLGQVFLTGFQVESIQIDGLKPSQLDKISDAISKMLEDIYSKYPIYTLGDDIKQKTAKMLVKKVKIINKAATIYLGL